MKTTYYSGKYKLTYDDSLTGQTNQFILLDLTATRAKCLMLNHFYEKLGFSEIELVEN
jgi:hypothetical protein